MASTHSRKLRHLRAEVVERGARIGLTIEVSRQVDTADLRLLRRKLVGVDARLRRLADDARGSDSHG